MNVKVIAGVVVVLCAGGYVGASAYVNAQAEKRIDEELEKSNATAPFIITKESVSTSLFNQEVALNNVSISAKEGGCPGVVATVEKLSGLGFQDKLMEPGSGDLVLQGISVPIRKDCMKNADELIEMLGGDNEIRADVNASYSLDEEGNYSADLSATAHKLAETKFAVDLGGMKVAMELMKQAATSPDQMENVNPMAFMDITISRLKFEFTDKGFKQYAITRAAKEAGMSAEDYMAQELAKVRKTKEEAMAKSQTEEQKALTEKAMTAVENFAGDKDRIGLEIKMKEPVKIMEAYMKIMMSMAMNAPADFGDVEYDFYN